MGKMMASNPSASPTTAHRRRWRMQVWVTLPIAIGCLAGCIARSPSQRAAGDAGKWLEVAARLERANPNQWRQHLNKILRPVRFHRGASVLLQLAKQTNELSDRQRWLLGRAYLWAAAAYFDATYFALTERQWRAAQQFCLLAVDSLQKAAKVLPALERGNAQRWAEQGWKVAERIATEPFYAVTHLEGLRAKVITHAQFVPPFSDGD